MSERAFSLAAGIIFLLIALGHLVRVAFAVPFTVSDVPIPIWLSLVAVAVAGFLSYEGFHFARKAGPKP
jgi:hypothetical protein